MPYGRLKLGDPTGREDARRHVIPVPVYNIYLLNRYAAIARVAVKIF